jgi:hypothetical protein
VTTIVWSITRSEIRFRGGSQVRLSGVWHRLHRGGLVYPPGLVTLPVGIFGLTDRGDVFAGTALTILLIAVTLAVCSACPACLRGRRGRDARR